MKLQTILVVLAVAVVASADVYMQNPRGSNNRVDNANNAPANRLFDSQNNNAGGYNSGVDSHGMLMTFYQESHLTMEWTAQHACGLNPNAHCQMIIQFKCAADMRDGTSTDRPQDSGDPPYLHALNGLPTLDRGQHETYANWYGCTNRDRNQGLFIADQNVGNQARSTRQNGGGGRSGYECAEERDYYPYWHPAEWKDLAIMTSNTSNCDMYQAESQNVKGKNYCTNEDENNAASCAGNGGIWMEQAAWGIDPPDCVPAPTSDDNHHSFAGDDVDPISQKFAHYNMSVPEEAEGNCVFRLRYNISTADYDGWTTDASSNGAQSPVEQDPTVDIGVGLALQLNINTAQFGRTFQDRTHVMNIQENDDEDGDEIWNLNVRGKRGNIVQVYPSVEYDFAPNRFHMPQGEYVHFQWTGSDNNPQGTDRNNWVELDSMNIAYPRHISQYELIEAYDDQRSLALSGYSNDPDLQDMPAYFNYMLIEMESSGDYNFICTKNNAYTNRGQKGTVIVEYNPTGLIVGLSVAGAAAVVGGGAAAFYFKGQKSASSSSGRF